MTESQTDKGDGSDNPKTERHPFEKRGGYSGSAPKTPPKPPTSSSSSAG